MVKDPAERKPRASAGRSATPTGLKSELARIDRELVRLLNERARLWLQWRTAVAERDGATPLASPVDEQAEQTLAAGKGPLAESCLKAIYRELASGTAAIDHLPRVAFLGPAYTYSHVATLHRFGSSMEPILVGSIAAVFEEVHRGHAEFGLAPVENSTDGRIADTLETFTRLRVRVCGEVPLRVHHALLGVGTRADVTEVYSKPQALSQCRNWLARHLPGVRVVEVASTSTAAQLAREKPGAAAIASAEAGAFYGLKLLAEQIEDQTNNITRFFVIGQDVAPRTGNDKTSAMFEVQHRPGALADAMNVFKRNRLNLTWIESFPIARPEGGYLFFTELEGHETDLKVKRAFSQLEKKTVRFEVLGSYPRSQPVG